MALFCAETPLGASEMMTFAATFDMPTSASWRTKGFAKATLKIFPHVRDLARESQLRAIREEQELTHAAASDAGWDGDDEGLVFHGRFPASMGGQSYTCTKISVGADAHWPQRASGHSYRSCGGVVFLIGEYTRKCLSVVVKSKQCSVCTAAAKAGTAAEEHFCRANHLHSVTHKSRSSKAMEPDAIVEALVEIAAMNLGDEGPHPYAMVTTLCLDDDATTRAHLVPLGDGVHKEGTYLPAWHPTVATRADRGHRIRTLKSKFWTWILSVAKGGGGESKIDQKNVSGFCKVFGRFLSIACKQHNDDGVDKLKKAFEIAGMHMCGDHTECPKIAADGIIRPDGWCKSEVADWTPMLEFVGEKTTAAVRKFIKEKVIDNDSAMGELLTTALGRTMETNPNEGINNGNIAKCGKRKNLARSVRLWFKSLLTLLGCNEGRLYVMTVIERVGLHGHGYHTRKILLRQEIHAKAKADREASKEFKEQGAARELLRTQEIARQASEAARSGDVGYESGIAVGIGGAAAAASSASTRGGASTLGSALAPKQKEKKFICPICTARRINPIPTKAKSTSSAGLFKLKHYKECYAEASNGSLDLQEIETVVGQLTSVGELKFPVPTKK